MQSIFNWKPEWSVTSREFRNIAIFKGNKIGIKKLEKKVSSIDLELSHLGKIIIFIALIFGNHQIIEKL